MIRSKREERMSGRSRAIFYVIWIERSRKEARKKQKRKKVKFYLHLFG